MFIVDSLQALIKTKSKTLSITESTGGSFQFASDNPIEIKGGWSPQNLISIDTTSSISVNIENARFDMDMVEMQTGGKKSLGSANFYHLNEIFTATVADTITIPYAVVANTVSIDGMTETTEATPTANTFKVTTTGESTTVKFSTGSMAIGKSINVKSYAVAVTQSNTIDVLTDSTSEIGSVILQTPIYESEEENSGISCYMQIEIYKAKIKRELNIDGAYKSAKTFSISIESIDARRADKKMFSIRLIPVTAKA